MSAGQVVAEERLAEMLVGAKQSERRRSRPNSQKPRCKT